MYESSELKAWLAAQATNNGLCHKKLIIKVKSKNEKFTCYSLTSGKGKERL